MKLTLDIRDERIHAVVDGGSGLQQLATGFDFVEGPVWHPVERSLIFSDILGNSLYSWSAADGVVQRRRNSYMANGNAYDLQGRLLTCEHATSRLTRSDLTNGDYTVLATHYDGKQLNSPNDVVVKRDGAIYFTDPTSGRSAGYGVPRAPELPYSGVYRLLDNTLTLLVDDFAKPNGLCFSRDEQRLFVNDTVRQHIRVFDVAADGSLHNGRVWAETRGEGVGVPDGMKIDEQQNVYCCGPGGIHLFDADAACLGVIRMPEQTANFVFGDADYRSLFITASTSLYRLRVHVPGWLTFRR